jgi:hypothetical protein
MAAKKIRNQKNSKAYKLERAAKPVEQIAMATLKSVPWIAGIIGT